MRVWSVPLRTRFRGIDVREGVLLRGDAGWGEWSPFLEYPPDVAEPWLRCAEEAAAGDWPAPVRSSVPVNVTVPAVDADASTRDRACRWLHDGQGQGRRTGTGPGRRPGPGRGGARRPGPGRPGADRRQRRLAGRRGGRRDPAAGSRGRRPGVRRAAVRDRRGAGRRTPGGRRTDRRGRVDPPCGRPLPRPRPRGGRRRGAQGAAARWGAGLPADRGGHRAAGRRLLGAGDVGRHRGRCRPGRRPARAAVRLRAGDRAAADRRRRDRAAAAGRRRPARAVAVEVDEAALDRLAAAPERAAAWEARLAEVRAVRKDHGS